MTTLAESSRCVARACKFSSRSHKRSTRQCNNQQNGLPHWSDLEKNLHESTTVRKVSSRISYNDWKVALPCYSVPNHLIFLSIFTKFFTVRKRSCEKVMFSQVCVKNSVHSGEVYTPLADTPRADTPGQTPPRQTPPQQTATAADGTHPTGMHSCL